MLRHLRTAPPLIFAALILFVGIFLSGTYNLYTYWEHFDTTLHVFGGLAAAWFGLVIFQREITHLVPWKQVVIFVSFATLIGVVWEFAEYLVGISPDVIPWLYQWFHGGDLPDTLMDLGADVIGALALTLWALEKERR